MNKIGVHALTFIGDIENHSIESCLSRVAKIGYDVMELPLLNPDALDTSFVSKTYEKFNIEPLFSMWLPARVSYWEFNNVSSKNWINSFGGLNSL